ncbi:hypothetical protein CC86DRAFT_381223 [Ophiobolus disseminans]|uniref:Uncharacterized protein n=1 Tax=Ophiobolus disseminans TaxID=1469910 RepID=A0A6A7A1E5_9PLEO|nr:hypothetical protein CC86DRAFT_381223 [Ophiobolus disseminans]
MDISRSRKLDLRAQLEIAPTDLMRNRDDKSELDGTAAIVPRRSKRLAEQPSETRRATEVQIPPRTIDLAEYEWAQKASTLIRTSTAIRATSATETTTAATATRTAAGVTATTTRTTATARTTSSKALKPTSTALNEAPPMLLVLLAAFIEACAPNREVDRDKPARGEPASRVRGVRLRGEEGLARGDNRPARGDKGPARGEEGPARGDRGPTSIGEPPNRELPVERTPKSDSASDSIARRRLTASRITACLVRELEATTTFGLRLRKAS